MKVSVWVIGKTNEKYLVEGIHIYLQRLPFYTKFEYVELKDVKQGTTQDETLKREADMVISKLKSDDLLVLLDEKGQTYSSIQFSEYLNKCQNSGAKSIIFLVGGAFGHHSLIRDRANHLISLSKMTFSHQMVRLFLLEQIYRGFTILRNEKYHNE